MLSALPAIIENNLQWWVAAAIVLVGLGIYGFGDLMRLSMRRIWAISGVSFAESIRRRVLWITPLAVIGVIVVSQLQKPTDEQDAIRQTIKYSLFAAGMVVTITAIILACTSLPKEIDTRVIYTVVTKPTTRLEIVLGKVLGFARVSAAILLIMGLFTLGYLQLRAWTLRSDIVQRLNSGTLDPAARPTLQYWADKGLLGARTLEQAADMQVYARPPESDDTRRWMSGTGEGQIVVPFRITPDDLNPPGAAIRVHVGFDAAEFGRPAQPPPPPLPVGIVAPDLLPTTSRSADLPGTAALGIEILDENLYSLIGSDQINGGQPILLSDPTGRKAMYATIPPEVSLNLLRAPVFYVSLTGLQGGVDYFVDLPRNRDPDPAKAPVVLMVAGADPQPPRVIGPMDDRNLPDYQPALPSFRGRSGQGGQQLRGGQPASSPLALYRFRGAAPRSAGGPVGFELRIGIEIGGDDLDRGEPTRLEITVLNKDNTTVSQPVSVYPENNRTAYFTVPAEALGGGNFDVHLRNLTNGHYANLQPGSLVMIASQESFHWNLIKSLLILWMLSILVVIISVFCSTFLSWPIAVVLTLVMLLGHWGVLQLGDATAPGIGNLVASDLGFREASQAKVVSASVEALSRLLNAVAAVLPDIGQFSAIEDIERGITITADKLVAPLAVLAAFGLPMLVVTYVLLRNKEVAP